jgi:hypothetical protein
MIHLYRGIGTNNKINSMSWTDDINTAFIFAKRFNVSGGKLIEATFPKNIILYYYNDSKEPEYLINTNKFNKKYIDRIYPVDSYKSVDELYGG